jgi:hypothetical protein
MSREPEEQLADWQAKTDLAAKSAPLEHADFLPMAHEAMPKLLAAIQAVRALHTPTYPMEGPDVACFHCAVPATTGKFTWVPWPCPTVRALTDALGGGDDAE